MNKSVLDGIRQVVDNWRLETKNYTFETRTMIGPQESPIKPGEYELRFNIHVDGFFEDIAHQRPISLDFTSELFITQNLSISEPDNINGDAYLLKQFLNVFTQDCYDQICDRLTSYGKSYTSDPLHMKGTSKRN